MKQALPMNNPASSVQSLPHGIMESYEDAVTMLDIIVLMVLVGVIGGIIWFLVKLYKSRVKEEPVELVLYNKYLVAQKVGNLAELTISAKKFIAVVSGVSIESSSAKEIDTALTSSNYPRDLREKLQETLKDVESFIYRGLSDEDSKSLLVQRLDNIVNETNSIFNARN
jgi:uncharacterized membrane-anchored protein